MPSLDYDRSNYRQETMMPRYHVTVHFARRFRDDPNSCGYEIEAETPEDACLAGKRMAKAAHWRSIPGNVFADLLPDETPVDEPDDGGFAEAGDIVDAIVQSDAVAVAIGEPAKDSETWQERLTDEQRAEIESMIAALPERSGTRLALELALHTDAESRPRQCHDFGPQGSARYCKRPGCAATNQPPVNRWGCKGAA